jgi:hypothetical protein
MLAISPLFCCDVLTLIYSDLTRLVWNVACSYFDVMLTQRATNARRAVPSNSNGRVKKGAERRRSERLPLGIPVFVRGIDDHGKEFQEFTTAFNISSGGALIATKRYLPSSSLISLEIPSAPLPRMATAPVFIRNLPAQPVTVSHNEQCYLVGLKFSKTVHRLAKGKA